MSLKVVDHPATAALPLDYFDQEADRMRQRQAKRISDAVQRYQLATSALDAARKAEQSAHKEREEAHRELRGLMNGRERVVIGKTLLTCNANGGLTIEPVEVMS